MAAEPPLFTHTSATAIDLGKKLTEVIHEYRGTHARITDTDVRHALRLAERDAGVSLQRGTVTVLAAGVLLAGVFGFLLYEATTGPGWPDFGAMAWFGGVLVLALVLVYLVARR